MEVLVESPVSLTESAIKEIRNIIATKSIPADYGLRVGVKGGGCSGLSYVLGFDLQKENDNLYKIDDISLIMEKSHGMYLAGMEIDFVDGLNNRGFSFNNPNATKTCGCGLVLNPEKKYNILKRVDIFYSFFLADYKVKL